jgi:hypothetical protein
MGKTILNNVHTFIHTTFHKKITMNNIGHHWNIFFWLIIGVTKYFVQIQEKHKFNII